MREARSRAGLSGREAGRRARLSQSKISKIESGALLPSIGDVDRLCGVYDVDSQEQEELVALVAQLRGEASAKVILARGTVEFQKRIRQLEASAALIRSFQPTLVIGLLQTAAYAEVVFATPDSRELSAEEIEENVGIRDSRQAALFDGSKQFVLIMTEGALRWQAGSPSVMVEQLEALAEVTKYPNVRVGIIPWTTPMKFFPKHGFHLYDEDAVIVATETATATMTGEADIATYGELFGYMEETAAFGELAHEHFMRIANEYRSIGDLT